jgi:hypothetical protein
MLTGRRFHPLVQKLQKSPCELQPVLGEERETGVRVGILWNGCNFFFF